MGARSGSLPIVGNLINCGVAVYLTAEDGHGDMGTFMALVSMRISPLELVSYQGCRLSGSYSL